MNEMKHSTLPVSRPEVNVAMRPITVRSPVHTTMPRAVPVKRQVKNYGHIWGLFLTKKNLMCLQVSFATVGRMGTVKCSKKCSVGKSHIWLSVSVKSNESDNSDHRGLVLPSTQLVEKNAMLRVSRGLSWVQSGDLVWGSDSPVRDELSTWIERYKNHLFNSYV